MATNSPPRIFSSQRRKSAYARAEQRGAQAGAARFILEDILEDFGERIAFMRLEPARSLLVGGLDTPFKTGGALERSDPRSLDEDSPLPPPGYDLILNAGSLATINDLPGALLHIRNALGPGGIAMASIVGAGSLANLRRAMIAAEPDRPAARMHPLIDQRAATALMERAGFRRFVVDSRLLDVAYRSLDRLVGDLRDQALGNQLAQLAPPLSKAALGRARSAFLDHADANGRVVERFEILTLTGWRD